MEQARAEERKREKGAKPGKEKKPAQPKGDVKNAWGAKPPQQSFMEIICVFILSQARDEKSMTETRTNPKQVQTTQKRRQGANTSKQT